MKGDLARLNVSKAMDDAIAHIVTAFEEPLNEGEVKLLVDLFHIKLNHASGNLTEKEAVAGVNNLDRKDALLECTFTSEWDNGTAIVTRGLYNRETGHVSSDISDISDSTPDKDALLNEEYIDVVIRGESVRYSVCPHCHEYIMQYASSEDDELHCCNCG